MKYGISLEELTVLIQEAPLLYVSVVLAVSALFGIILWLITRRTRAEAARSKSLVANLRDEIKCLRTEMAAKDAVIKNLRIAIAKEEAQANQLADLLTEIWPEEKATADIHKLAARVGKEPYLKEKLEQMVNAALILNYGVETALAGDTSLPPHRSR